MDPRRSTERKPTPPFPRQHQDPPGEEARLDPRPRYEAPEYRAADKLEGKVALVTGGDSGIGRAVCVLYAREGADVAFTYLPEEERDAEETLRAVEEEGARAIAIPCDVTRYEECERAVQRTVDELGQLDILVNNAAYQQHVDDIDELDLDHWERTFDVNIHGYFRMVKAALPHLEPGSVIIQSGSETGFEGSKGLLDYSATKGAIHAFTKSLAQHLLDRGVRVNCVAPGPVWTPLNPSDKPAEQVAHFGEKTPMGRPAQPEEIAPAYVFLASAADSSYITGEVLALLGGQTKAG
jgi:NAD(P)-dependent dehydrogenase (short-subunit alcohol dehydrogenase family)